MKEAFITIKAGNSPTLYCCFIKIHLILSPTEQVPAARLESGYTLLWLGKMEIVQSCQSKALTLMCLELSLGAK